MTQRLPRFLLLAGIAFALTLYRIWVINHLWDNLAAFNGGSGWLYYPNAYGDKTPWIYFVPGADPKSRTPTRLPANTTPLVGRPGT